MKKRAFALALSLILILSALSACSSNTESAADPAPAPADVGVADDDPSQFEGRTLELLLNVGGGGNYYEPVAKKLESVYPGLTVNLIYDLSAPEMMKSRTLAGDAPDIFNINQGMYDYYGAIEEGVCAPLDPYLDLPTLDGMATLRDVVDLNLMVKGYVDGQYYMFPEVVFTSGLWYDASLLAEKGIDAPTDWDSFLAACAQLKEDDIYGVGYCGLMAHEYPLDYWFYPMLASIDYDTFVKVQNLEEDAWDSDGMLSAVSRLQQLRDSGYIYTPSIALGNNETQMDFIAHKFAFLPCGSWLEAEMQDAWTDNWDVTYLPFSGRSDAAGDNYIHMITLPSSVYSGTKNADIVGEFYRYLYSDPDTITEVVGVAQNGLPIADFGSNYGSLLNKSTGQTWTAIDEGSVSFLSLTTAWYSESSAMFADAFNAFMGGDIDGDTFRERMKNTMQSYIDDPDVPNYTYG